MRPIKRIWIFLTIANSNLFVVVPKKIADYYLIFQTLRIVKEQNDPRHFFLNLDMLWSLTHFGKIITHERKLHIQYLE